VGQQHVAKDPLDLGYDQVADIKSNRAEHVAPAAVDFLNNTPEAPFFLAVGFFETHRPFPDFDEDPRFSLPPHPLPDVPEVREDVAAYKASAAELDRGIGAVLDALDANGLAADTLVVSTTDHGLAFPWMKCNLTDHGIGVSLIMRGPGGFIGGNVCDAMISQIDIYPTLCELAGIPVPNWVQGKSFMPVINGDIDEVNDAIFAEVSYHAAYEPKRAVRTRRWKYIRRFGDKTTPVLPNIDGSPSKDVLLDHGLRERTLSGEYLYDLIYDPSESHNLAESSDASGVVTDLRRRLDDWMVATDDPLLNGPVPLPDGAVVNDPDGTSPGEKPARIPPS